MRYGRATVGDVAGGRKVVGFSYPVGLLESKKADLLNAYRGGNIEVVGIDVSVFLMGSECEGR